MTLPLKMDSGLSVSKHGIEVVLIQLEWQLFSHVPISEGLGRRLDEVRYHNAIISSRYIPACLMLAYLGICPSLQYYYKLRLMFARSVCKLIVVCIST